MKLSRLIPLLVPLVLAGALTSIAPASGSKHAALVISHQMHGCHVWSLNGGTARVSQTVTIRRGGSIRVTNIDVMPHKLVKTSGHAVTYTRVSAGTTGLKGTFGPAMLARMGASSTITFAKSGVYRFTTRAGEDYMPGMKTTGEDYVLRLIVRVA